MINYISENVLCSNDYAIVTEIYFKSLGTKKWKNGLVKKIKRTIYPNVII